MNLFTGRLGAKVEAECGALDEIRWPSARWRDDPAGFCSTILGLEPWSRQTDMLEGIRDHQFGAVAAGRKVSKSCSIACAALWFYSSFENARVVLMSTTARQVDEILWTEVRQLKEGSGRCVKCRRDDPHGPKPCPHSAQITGDLKLLARSGLKSHDFRSIVGYTTRDPVAAQGTSGYNLLYLVDEASGVADTTIDALEGNCAGGGRLWLLGNPNKARGRFADAHLKKDAGFFAMRISSEESPNVVEGRVIIPGLATRDYIERMRKTWGENSALYKIHVRGEFVLGEDGKAISVALIAEATERWHETEATGRLQIGLDPAGEGGQGDETTFAARRGRKHVHLSAHLGLDENGILAELLQIVGKLRAPGEVPVVAVDSEGSIGAPLYGVLKRYAYEHPGSFEVVRVRASQLMPPSSIEIPFERVRDALWGNLRDWLQNGGAILEDEKLAQELNAVEFTHNDRLAALKITPKKDIRKEIGRSPDRADALALAVWERGSSAWAEDGDTGPTETAKAPDVRDAPLDPWAGLDAFGL